MAQLTISPHKGRFPMKGRGKGVSPAPYAEELKAKLQSGRSYQLPISTPSEVGRWRAKLYSYAKQAGVQAETRAISNGGEIVLVFRGLSSKVSKT